MLTFRRLPLLRHGYVAAAMPCLFVVGMVAKVPEEHAKMVEPSNGCDCHLRIKQCLLVETVDHLFTGIVRLVMITMGMTNPLHSSA